MSGADLAVLVRRLAETPHDFLAEPRIGTGGEIVVAALVHDLLHMHGGRADAQALARFEGADARADRNRLALAAILVWLLADEALLAARPGPDALLAVLDGMAAEMAGLTPAHQFVQDAERREELVRAALARLGIVPHGETGAQAADRLAAISAVQRRALLAASRAAEKRAREVREALARKLAAESADKWTRE